MKRSILLFYLLLSSVQVLAQMEMSAFTATGRGGVATTFATDYQAVGINPANLGFRKSFRDPKYTLGFFEFNTTFFTQALDRAELFSTIFKPAEDNFTFAEKEAAANTLANTNLSLNVDAMLLGGFAQLPGGHGVAFSIRDRIQFFGQINPVTAELAFLGANSSYFPELILSDGSVIPNPRATGGPNLDEDTQQRVALGQFRSPEEASLYSEILDGTRVSSSWFREYNFSYGKQLYDSYNFSLFAGVGARILSGLLLIDLKAENGALSLSNISASPTFGLDFGDSTQITNPTFRGTDNASMFRTIAFPKPVGTGFGMDLGITMVVKQNLYIGLAATNIGQMSWNGNVYQVNDGRLVQFAGSGFNNFNVLGSNEGTFQFAGEKSPLRWEGSNSINVPLPGTLRFGVSYEYFRTYHIGLDIIAPTNNVAGNLERTLWALGADIRVSKLFRVSTGLNYGGNNQSKVNLPVGVTYIARRGFYEAGLATRDLVTYLTNIGGGSTVSFALGFLRFKY